MSEERDGNPNNWPAPGKVNGKIVSKDTAGFYVQASNDLLRFYRKKTDSGKYVSSPYESLVFGRIYNFTSSMGENDYGYCSKSVDFLAWEL